MKIIIPTNDTKDVKFFDDHGNELQNLGVTRIKMDVTPNEEVVVELTVILSDLSYNGLVNLVEENESVETEIETLKGEENEK